MTDTLRRRLQDGKDYLDKQLTQDRVIVPGGGRRIWVDPKDVERVSDAVGDAIDMLDKEPATLTIQNSGMPDSEWNKPWYAAPLEGLCCNVPHKIEVRADTDVERIAYALCERDFGPGGMWQGQDWEAAANDVLLVLKAIVHSADGLDHAFRHLLQQAARGMIREHEVRDDHPS